MFRRKAKPLTAAGGWLRDPDAPLSKSKPLSDGQVTALLLGQHADSSADIEKDAFESLLRLRQSLAKASGSAALAYAIGLLTLSNMLTGLSASGMQIERGGFGHVSLLLMGLANFWWATTFAKVCYITSWFGWRMKSADPPRKAVLLLRFPEAFPYFVFFPATRGYPKHIWPVRSEYDQIASIVLIVAAVLIFALGAFALNLALAIEVWRSDYPTPAAAKLAVAGSAVLSLLGLAVPRFNDIRIRYHHYGFTNLLAAMPPDRQNEAYRRIAAVTARLALKKDAETARSEEPPAPGT